MAKVRVPHADDMDDETFLKHLEIRHALDTDVEEFVRVNVVDAWLDNYRAFHERCHEINPRSHYQHKHKEVGE